MYRVNQLVPNLAKGKWAFDPTVGTIITEFQSGHGFTTSGADASSNVNDTLDFTLGTQAAKVVSAGTGASAVLQNTGITSIDTTSKQVMVLLKVDDITHLSSLNFSMGNGGFTNEYHISFNNQGCVTSGEWVVVTLAIQDAATSGSPIRSGITAIRVYHKDDNTGNKVTVHWGGIYFMPNAAAQPGAPYPKGVASICFDDSYATTYDVAKPLLDAAGFRASEYVIKDTVGQAARETVTQLKKMQNQAGWEINSHCMTDTNHGTRDTGLTAEQLLWDKSTEKEWLLNNGLEGQGYAYPGGSMNQSVIDVIRKYYRYARGTQGLTETYPAGDPYRLKAFSTITPYSGGYSPANIYTATTGKIDLAVTNASWLILVFHKIIPAITSVTVVGTTATVTFASNHPFSSGSSITFAGFTPSGLNATATISCGSQYTTNTLTYTVAGGTGNATVIGTALGATTDCDYASYQTIVNKLVSSGIAVLPIGEVLAGQGIPATAGLGASVGSSTPVVASAVAPTAGIATTVARSDHAHPRYDWQPADHGYLAWAYDPALCSSSSILGTAGTVYVVRLHAPLALSVNNIAVYVSTSGSGLTANQCIAGIYQGGTLLGSTGDQSAVWNSTGVKSMALTGGPIALAAGDFYVAFYANGTTLPTFGRVTSNGVANAGIAAASSRFGSADTGRTTSLAATLGTISALSISYWAAVS